MKKNRLLIIGKVPPPVGGITVHVDRLLYYLNEKEVKHKFVELRVKNAFRLLIALLQNKTFHLHTSNSKIKFALVIIGKLLGNRVIATLHTDIDRHVGLDGWFEKCVIKIADIPIVLNKNSYHKANKLNKSTILLSAFLPPYTLTRLSSLYQEQLRALKMKTKKTYCTNASKFGLDKNGQEIYGILKILSLFKNHPDYGLVISDSSGDYQRYFSQNNIKLSSNILVISEIHDFNAVINETDGMIRFTTVDGDAVSVKEALYHGKPVWASSVVSRPDGVVLIHDLADLENHIFNQTPPKVKPFLDESLVKLITIYKKQS